MIFCTECQEPASFIEPGAAPITTEAFGIPISVGKPTKGWCTRCWLKKFNNEDAPVGRKPKDKTVELAREDVEELDNEAEIETQAVAAKTATGDMRDLILNTLRYEQDKRPWNQRSESEQRATASRVEASCTEFVTKLIEIMAAAGRRTITCTLSKATVKDNIQATIEIAKHDPLRHLLIDSINSRVLIVVADPSEYQGEREPAPITPDQGDLVKDAMVVHSTADKDIPFLPN